MERPIIAVLSGPKCDKDHRFTPPTIRRTFTPTSSGVSKMTSAFIFRPTECFFIIYYSFLYFLCSSTFAPCKSEAQKTAWCDKAEERRGLQRPTNRNRSVSFDIAPNSRFKCGVFSNWRCFILVMGRVVTVWVILLLFRDFNNNW